MAQWHCLFSPILNYCQPQPKSDKDTTTNSVSLSAAANLKLHSGVNLNKKKYISRNYIKSFVAMLIVCESRAPDLFKLYIFCIPVREQEGTDVRHRRGWRPEFCQRHDVFKGDVSLSAHIHHMDFLRGAMGAPAGGPPDDLHHDGVLGRAKGFHSLFMAGLGQLFSIHLRITVKNCILLCAYFDNFLA